ncbi:carbon-phosphorus lyase complex subunit PhnI [Opitutales bacterium ASA1]|uniref:carbon-phosphorus lyase complex subunit PhnI n=1 Tax=Congregicoccus parvus TaxID=3081749 RepID=UPI002B2F22EC|nr:carbon-phosphorus lyase complex subunit PhnI [Opitutales bacterium ASA1]
MGYVAIKGGEDAIAQSNRLVEYYRLRDRSEPLAIEQIQGQFRLLSDKIMGEASLYAPEHAALVIKQNEGDVFESAFMLRAYRATLQRRYWSETLDTRAMFVRRRISSAFREIPGGQILGPTRDYTQRLLDSSLVRETLGSIEEFLSGFELPLDPTALAHPRCLPKVIDLLTSQGLLRPVDGDADRRVVDVTREAIKFPAPRSASLQMLARAETGGLMALAYSAQRGFGSTHATVGELRVGEVPLRVRDARGRVRHVGRIRLTEAEMISKIRVRAKDAVPYLSLGYGLCFGQNETKAICMGILDRAMRTGGDAPCQSQEFVLYHTEGIESYGFTNHLKLPHYVTFQSGLTNLRQAVERRDKKRGRLGFGMSDARAKEQPTA